MRRWPLAALGLAALVIALAAWGFGRGLVDYQHVRQPLSLLSATGAPGWRIANLLLFVLPGLLVAAVAWAMRGRLSPASPWALRMALQLGLLAALGYALQGVCNLDPNRLPDDGPNRWHAVAWMLWWLAFAASAALMACSRGVPRGLRIFSVLAAAFVAMAMAMAGAMPWPAALVYRIGIAGWLGWWALVVLALSRGEASSPGSLPTAGR